MHLASCEHVAGKSRKVTKCENRTNIQHNLCSYFRHFKPIVEIDPYARVVYFVMYFQPSNAVDSETRSIEHSALNTGLPPFHWVRVTLANSGGNTKSSVGNRPDTQSWPKTQPDHAVIVR